MDTKEYREKKIFIKNSDEQQQKKKIEETVCIICGDRVHTVADYKTDDRRQAVHCGRTLGWRQPWIDRTL